MSSLLERWDLALDEAREREGAGFRDPRRRRPVSPVAEAHHAAIREAIRAGYLSTVAERFGAVRRAYETWCVEAGRPDIRAMTRSGSVTAIVRIDLGPCAEAGLRLDDVGVADAARLVHAAPQAEGRKARPLRILASDDGLIIEVRSVAIDRADAVAAELVRRLRAE